MHTKEVLSIVALGALGLCLLMGLGKMAMKNPAKKAQMDKACGFLVFVAAALVGVTQVLKIGGGNGGGPGTGGGGPAAGTEGGHCLPPRGDLGVPSCNRGLKCMTRGDYGVPICMKREVPWTPLTPASIPAKCIAISKNHVECKKAGQDPKFYGSMLECQTACKPVQ